MHRIEFVTPWIVMRRDEVNIRNEMKRLSKVEPFVERHSMTYFNNRKWERITTVTSAYDRLHDITPFDPRKPRCDRMKRALIWDEIHQENKSHIIPMTVNNWYGRPNRIQVDYPDMKSARSSKTREFYCRHAFNLTLNIIKEKSC